MLGIRIEKGMLPTYKEEDSLVGKRITKETIDKFKKAKIDRLSQRKASLVNRVFGSDVIDPETGEVIFEQGTTLTEETFEQLKKYPSLKFRLISSSGYVFQPTIALTLTQDKSYTEEEALKDVHTKMWPGDSASLEEVKERLYGSFFNPRLYDLTKVGRIRMNRKLGLTFRKK